MNRLFAAAIVLGALMVFNPPARGEDAPDSGTPKGAAAAFFKAVENGDLAGAKALATGSDKQLAMLDTLVPMIHGFKRLETAATRKWGEEGRKEITRASANPGATDLSSKLIKAREEIIGDTATITPAEPKADDKEPTKLKKIEGKWKMDMTSIQAEGADDPKAAEVMKKLGEAALGVAAEIDQGKYADAKSAKAALDQKIIVALGLAGAPAEPKK